MEGLPARQPQGRRRPLGPFPCRPGRLLHARQAANDEIDQEYGANLTVKEALLVEANALLPIKDLAAAKKALQSIRDRWEEAGKVPRADMRRVEAGLRKVEDAVRHAEDENWRRSNPETKARTNSALTQLEAAIASLEDDLEAGAPRATKRKIQAAEEALEARQAWLEKLRKSASGLPVATPAGPRPGR